MLYQVTTVIFDKTGTLTKGTPSVTKVAMFVDEEVCPMNFFLALVATLEANSDHPLAYAIINNSKQVSNKNGWVFSIIIHAAPFIIYIIGRNYMPLW